MLGEGGGINTLFPYILPGTLVSKGPGASVLACCKPACLFGREFLPPWYIVSKTIVTQGTLPLYTNFRFEVALNSFR